MRVIAGNFKGRPLKTLSGDQTRPTSDKIKGSIFNRIGPFFDGGRVLDLFSGSGNLAIEAISRGMDQAVCVDASYSATKIIQENVSLVKAEKQFIILKMTAERALERLRIENGRFDLIFLDPPYGKVDILQCLEQLKAFDLCGKNSQIVCETDQSLVLPEYIEGFEFIKSQKYGRTIITIYTRED